ncbi:MAG: Rnase Y domain-containing protein, partial [Gemmatimonadales bacterium]
MESLITILAAAAALVVGAFGGRALEVRRARAAKRTAEDEAARILEGAGAEADNLRRTAELQGKEESYRLKQELLEE